MKYKKQRIELIQYGQNSKNQRWKNRENRLIALAKFPAGDIIIKERK